MLKRLAYERANRVLANVREHIVQRFAGQLRTYTRRAVYRSQTKVSFSRGG